MDNQLAQPITMSPTPETRSVSVVSSRLARELTDKNYQELQDIKKLIEDSTNAT